MTSKPKPAKKNLTLLGLAKQFRESNERLDKIDALAHQTSGRFDATKATAERAYVKAKQVAEHSLGIEKGHREYVRVVDDRFKDAEHRLEILGKVQKGHIERIHELGVASNAEHPTKEDFAIAIERIAVLEEKLRVPRPEFERLKRIVRAYTFTLIAFAVFLFLLSRSMWVGG